MANGRGKGKRLATSKIPSKQALKPLKGKPSNTSTLKKAMMKLAGTHKGTEDTDE